MQPPQPVDINSRFKQHGTVATNSFRIDFEPTSKIHRYDVVIAHLQSTLILSKISKVFSRQRSITCHRLLKTVFRGNFENAYVYDGAAILYAAAKLPIPPQGFEKRYSCEQLIENDIQLPRRCAEGEILVRITECEIPGFQWELREVYREASHEGRTRAVIQFLEILFAHQAVSSERYFSLGNSLVLMTNAEHRGLITMNRSCVGSVAVVEGRANDELPMVEFTLDACVRLFYRSDMKLEVFLAIYLTRTSDPSNIDWTNVNIYRANRLLKGLRVYTSDARTGVVTFDSLRMVDIETTFEFIHGEDKMVPLAKLWKFEDIQRTTWPVLVGRYRHVKDELHYYPLERVGPLVEHQSVPTSCELYQQDLTCLKPDVRWDMTNRHMAELCLSGANLAANRVLQNFQVGIFNESERVEAYRRAPPIVMTGNNARATIDDKWSYRPQNGFRVETACELEFICCIGMASVEDDASAIRSFFSKLCCHLTRRGLKLPQKSEIDKYTHIVQGSTLEAAEKLLQGCIVHASKTFKVTTKGLIIYVDSFDIKSHRYLKNLEREYDFVTQHVTLELAKKVCEKSLSATLDQMMLKVNTKCGGQNFDIKPIDEGDSIWLKFRSDTLLIGADVSREGATGELMATPATVGISSNSGEKELLIFGDHSYQTPRQEQIEDSVLSKHVSVVLERFTKTRGRLPERILYVRDGVSSGQLLAVSHEARVIDDTYRRFARDRNQRTDILITAAVVCKRHNRRFYLENEKTGKMANTVPGTTVSTVLVEPDKQQFYMQSHHALIGTVKIPRYEIIRDDCRYTMDELQSLLLSQCFMHQVCFGPTSIPTPIYVAHECAKRGKELYHHFREQYPEECARIMAEEDYGALTERLGYANTQLMGIRYNA